METKLCKKCGVELSEGEIKKIKLCEACNDKRKHIIKKILIGAGTISAAIATVLIGIASKNKQDAHDIFDDYDDYSYDEEDDDYESLSVWDAAEIYLSSGFDEDYSFGYTHDELTNALK